MPIRTWGNFWIEKNNVVHDFSSVHIKLPGKIANEIMKWGKDHLAPEDIYNADGKYGREDDIHVTVLYGIHDASDTEAESLLRSERPITLELGGITTFTHNPAFDVLKIDVISPDLRRINKKLRESLEYTDKYPQYHPHVTIAYVKKDRCQKNEDSHDFECKRITCRDIIFSSKNGKKSTIELCGFKQLQIS